MSLHGEADLLARELFETKVRLRAAGRALHDEVGPLLSAAGIRLDLLRADYPQAGPAAREALLALDGAMERVRALSRELNPPPAAHLGLKNALGSLVQARGESFQGTIRYSYTASAGIPEEAAAAMYEAASAVIGRALGDRSATRLSVTVGGAREVSVRIESNGRERWPAAALASIERRARPGGIVLAIATKKGTIVSIRYAPRRAARG